MTPFPATVLPGAALSGTNACLTAVPQTRGPTTARPGDPGGMAPRASGEAREAAACPLPW
jgi:hypothetical protein